MTTPETTVRDITRASRRSARRRIALALFLCIAVATPASAQRTPNIALHPANAVFDAPDEQFTAITSIRELSNGQVLVADRGENRIALIDMAGQLSTPVSRTGDGPGEYRGVGWLLALGRDSSLFIDPAARPMDCFRWRPGCADDPVVSRDFPKHGPDARRCRWTRPGSRHRWYRVRLDGPADA
jgi:hypothetical protein